MGRSKPNDAQNSLKFLFYSVTGLGAVLWLLRLLASYLDSPGVASSLAILVATGYWSYKHWYQWNSQAKKDAQNSEHRAFCAEVERAWERSHPVERRQRERARELDHANWEHHKTHITSPKVQEQTEAEPSKKKKKKGKKNQEEVVIVEDELEAEMVEDVEDFLLHSRLRDKLKGAAEDVRERQRRQEEKQRQTEERRKRIEEEKKRPKIPEVTMGLPPPPSSLGVSVQGLPTPATVQKATSSKSSQKAKVPDKTEGSKQTAKVDNPKPTKDKSKDNPGRAADANDTTQKRQVDGGSSNRKAGKGSQHTPKTTPQNDTAQRHRSMEGHEAGENSNGKDGRGKGAKGRGLGNQNGSVDDTGGGHAFAESNPQEAASNAWWSSAHWGGAGGDTWWNNWQSQDSQWWGTDSGGWKFSSAGARGKGTSKASRGRGRSSRNTDNDVDKATPEVDEEESSIGAKSRGTGRGKKNLKPNSGEEDNVRTSDSAEAPKPRRGRGRGRQAGPSDAIDESADDGDTRERRSENIDEQSSRNKAPKVRTWVAKESKSNSSEGNNEAVASHSS